jgi:hypothetical protein
MFALTAGDAGRSAWLASKAFDAVLLVGVDFSRQRQAGVEAEMGDGDEGCVFDVRPEIQFAKDATLISHIVEQDDLAVCRDGANEVLTAQRCLKLWRQASGERQGCGQLVEQIHCREGIVDRQAAKAGGSAFSSGALSGFQFQGSKVANSWAFVRPDTMRSSTSVR